MLLHTLWKVLRKWGLTERGTYYKIKSFPPLLDTLQEIEGYFFDWVIWDGVVNTLLADSVLQMDLVPEGEITLLAIAIRVFTCAGGSGNTSATKVWETSSSWKK